MYYEKKNYIRFKKRSKIKTLYYASIYRKRIPYQNFFKDIFFFCDTFFPARCFGFITLDKKKNRYTYIHTYTPCMHTNNTRITANTDVFLVDTDRIVSWVRSYRMPNFRAFIALWPFDSRLSPFSTVICFERVVEEKESPFIVLLSNRFEKSRLWRLWIYLDIAIFFSFLIVKKKKEKRRVLVLRLLNRIGFKGKIFGIFLRNLKK